MKNPAFFITGFFVLMMLETFAQVCFKLTAIHAEPLTYDGPWLARAFATPWVYCSISGHIGAFVTWLTLLRHIPIGPAFAAAHVEVIGVMVVSIPVFGEILSPLQYLGAALIVLGILVLAFENPPRAEETSL